ncbi:large ribosomal subunit protein bL12m-like [Babylonia areolata]|uniref:large ribosomal subunit protein bL12m-like n=1 Tax=Babylonia areolata TaxID=304850 RepID=UPI003FD1371E
MQSTKAILRSVGVVSSYCRRLAQKQLKTCQCLSANHLYSTSTDVIPSPHVEGQPKIYAPKIEKLVEDISQLTLLEVADLNELLKKTLNIQDTPMMAMGAVAAPAAKEEEEEEVAPRKEKMAFTVKLTKFDDAKKVQLIKAIKGLIPNMNLVQAKKFVESSPQVVKADIPKDEAEKLKEELAAAGGVVEVE